MASSSRGSFTWLTCCLLSVPRFFLHTLQSSHSASGTGLVCDSSCSLAQRFSSQGVLCVLRHLFCPQDQDDFSGLRFLIRRLSFWAILSQQPLTSWIAMFSLKVPANLQSSDMLRTSAMMYSLIDSGAPCSLMANSTQAQAMLFAPENCCLAASLKFPKVAVCNTYFDGITRRLFNLH